METIQVTSLLSYRPAKCNIPVAVGLYRGLEVVACPPSRHHQYGDHEGCSSSAEILVHSVGDCQNYTLSGHNEEVLALCFSREVWPQVPGICGDGRDCSSSVLLCSVSSSSILLWNMDHIYQGEQTTPIILVEEEADDEAVHSVRFAPDCCHVVVCKGHRALVYNRESGVLDTSLVGHCGAVLQAFFMNTQPLTVATLSEDRTFKVWDLDNSSLVYQSHIISSSSPFVCGAMDPLQHHLATATADGTLRLFDLKPGGGYKCLLKSEVIKDLEQHKRDHSSNGGNGGVDGSRTISSRSTGSPPIASQGEEERPGVECGSRVLGMFYITADYSPTTAPEAAATSSIRELLQSSTYLLIVTHQAVMRYKGHTLELLDYLDFTEPLLSTDPGGFSWQQVPVIGSCDLFHTSNVSTAGDETTLSIKVLLASGGLFTNSITILLFTLPTEHAHSCPKESSVLSVLSSQPLLPSSPLRAEFNLKTTPTTGSDRGGRSSVGKAGLQRQSQSRAAGPMNQPLTFKSKVKSSGYTEAPRKSMFKPQIRSSPGRSGAKHSQCTRLSMSYPACAGPTAHLLHSAIVADRSAPLYTASFSGSGRELVFGCGDNSIYRSKGLPPKDKKITALLGHNGCVLTTGWSHSEQYLVSGSADKTVRVWTMTAASASATMAASASGARDQSPVLVIDAMGHNLKQQDKSHPKDVRNEKFKKEINFVQFYYMDKFLLLSCGNSTHLYKYYIETQPPDEIRRYQKTSRYKSVSTLCMKTAQTITALSAINDFHSYIVLVAGSNKCLEVYDMNVGQCARTISDVQSRAVHCICQNKGSKYISHGAESYDVFATSAVTDGIKVWDLRSSRCVQRYTSHINQSQASVLACFSPCSCYLATGSEDNSAYIYDLRGSSPLHRLAGHSDTVTALAYHPLKPLLVTTTLDGQVRYYTDTI